MADESIIIPISIASGSSNSELAKLGAAALQADGALNTLQGTTVTINQTFNVLQKTVEKVKKEFSQMGPAANGAANRMDDFNKRLREGNAASGSFNNGAKTAVKSLKDLKPGADQASQSLNDLSRIVQDAPYGFMAISNNLNPAIESFQRLKVSTGSTSGAFKALASSLKGPGGIGIALAALSTALTLAQIGFGAWTRGFGSGKAALDALKKSLEESAKTISTDIARLTTLVGVIKNVTTSTNDRTKALKAFKQEYGSYLGDLEKEKIGLNNIDKAYREVIDSMLRRAVVKGLQDQIAAEVEKTAKKIIEIESKIEQSRLNNEAKERKDRAKKARELKDAMQQRNAIVTDGVIANQRMAMEEKNVATETEFLQGKVRSLKEELLGTLTPLLNLTNQFEDLNIGLKKDPKQKDVAKEIISHAKEVANWFEENTLFEVNYRFSPLDSKEVALKKAQDFLSEVEKGLTKFRKGAFTVPPPEFKPPPPDMLEEYGVQMLDRLQNILGKYPLEPAIVAPVGNDFKRDIVDSYRTAFNNLKVQMPEIDYNTESGVEIDRKLKAALNNAKLQVPLYLNPQIPQGSSYTQAMEIAVAQLREQLIGVLAEFETSLAAGIGDALGNAIGGDFSNAFRGIFAIIGTNLQAIGRTMIQYGVAMQKLKIAIKTLNPAVAIGGGIALIAIGAAVRNKVSGATPFAEGGLVSGSVFANIGEGRSTSRNNPEVVSPLDKLKTFFGDTVMNTLSGAFGGSMAGNYGFNLNIPGSVTLRASGRDLVGVISLENRSQNRNF